MKIVSTGATLSSPEFYRKKKKQRQRRMWIGFGVFALLLGLIVFVTRLSNFRITEVTVTGAEAVNADEVKALAKRTLSGYYYYLVPKNNAALYPEENLKAALFKEFPRFSSVGLALDGFESLHINVVEREPHALYCGVSSEAHSDCYFLDESGFIFSDAPSFSPGVYFVYARTDAFEEPLGRQYLPAEEFLGISKFIESLKESLIEVTSLTLANDEFSLTLSHGGRILWDREDDPKRVHANLESFLSSEEIVGDREFIEKVAELDLRTEDKVFYRFK